MDNFKGAMLMKIVILLKENWSHMDKFSAMRTAGGRCVRKLRFPKEETAFAGSKCFSGVFISYSVRNEQLGAMRQKMAIFEERNSVCRVHIFLMLMMMMMMMMTSC